MKDAVVVLKNPKLEGDLKGADGAASVFIDIIGRPLTPLSYAGVARHIAALTTRATAGAAAAAYYAPYYRPPACG